MELQQTLKSNLRLVWRLVSSIQTLSTPVSTSILLNLLKIVVLLSIRMFIYYIFYIVNVIWSAFDKARLLQNTILWLIGYWFHPTLIVTWFFTVLYVVVFFIKF